jgi:hypothetical protein
MHAHDGKVRVFPAVPNQSEAAFILRAPGGFMVSSSKEQNKKPDHVFVSSAFGNDFHLVNPWQTQHLEIRTSNGMAVAFSLENGVLSFTTQADAEYLITPKGTVPGEKEFAGEPNCAPKHKGYTTIGKERDFNLSGK